MRLYFSLLFASFFLFSDQSFSPDLDGAKSYNDAIKELKGEVKKKHEKALLLSINNSDEGEYRSLLSDLGALKKKISSLEEKWRASSVMGGSSSEEGYALWDMGETTLSQLIMEYGASDYLYIIPPELSSMKISLYSSIPLPRESWNDMIESLLVQNGVGIRKLNPFAKQLFIMKMDPSSIEGVLSKPEDLELFSSQARLFFVLAPPPEQLKSLQAFFERFSDPKQTTIQAIGSKVALISTRDTIEKLLGLYRAIWEKAQGKAVRLIKSNKILPQEAEKVLKAFFTDSALKGRPNFSPVGADELMVLTLPQGLVLVGENETVSRGEKVIQDLECQLEDPGENVVYWYSCKHSDPEDIAAVLEKVYGSLIGTNLDKKGEGVPVDTGLPSSACANTGVPCPSPQQSSQSNPTPTCPGQSTIFNPVMPANPPFIQPGTIDTKEKINFGNFIVDRKTTSILMVVRREELPKIKSLLKKMDVPKRMVQLDVLLVEKKLTDRRRTGFDLLQIGKNDSGEKENAISFDTGVASPNKGIFNYLFSKNSGKFPAVDMRFNFLLAQEDVHINSNPSMLTTNQTPATISIVEEISINNGSFQTQSGALLEQSFTRAQYGTTIVLTPTVHLSQNIDEEEGQDFVSLKTNIEFDTTQITTDNRPPVTRRHVENEVCVPDGETIILGGLRSKMESDEREKIPFLGDLPGLGKLFGAVKQTDISKEMFIFITPRIVRSPGEDLEKIRQSEYKKRAGDIPEFLEALDEAKERERKKLFSNSLKTLFDMY